MNKAFLEDLKKEVRLEFDLDHPPDLGPLTMSQMLQLYIAEKLWSIEQLLQNQEQR